MVSIAHTSPFKGSFSYPKRLWAQSVGESEEFIAREKRAKFISPPSPSFSLESFEFLMAKSPATSSASGRLSNPNHLGPLRRSSEISFAQPQPGIGQEAAEATSRRQVYTEAASDIDLRIETTREVLFVSIIHFPPRTLTAD